jgi:hypothetical protein
MLRSVRSPTLHLAATHAYGLVTGKELNAQFAERSFVIKAKVSARHHRILRAINQRHMVAS